jgi:NADH:ubiquinone oxidoreductase subunit 2 (subunit N)
MLPYVPLLLLQVFFSILTSVVSSFYYIRLIKNVYFEPPRVLSSLGYSHLGVESVPVPVTKECSILLGLGFFFFNPYFLLSYASLSFISKDGFMFMLE